MLQIDFETRIPVGFEADKSCRYVFCLATDPGTDSDQVETAKGTFYLAAVAYTDRAKYESRGFEGIDWGFSQQATCRRCRTPLVSDMKDAICPVCGSDNRLT